MSKKDSNTTLQVGIGNRLKNQKKTIPIPPSSETLSRLKDQERIMKIKQDAQKELREEGRYGIHFAEDRFPDSSIDPGLHPGSSHVDLPEGTVERERITAITIYLEKASVAYHGGRDTRAKRFLQFAMEKMTRSEMILLEKVWPLWKRIIEE